MIFHITMFLFEGGKTPRGCGLWTNKLWGPLITIVLLCMKSTCCLNDGGQFRIVSALGGC